MTYKHSELLVYKGFLDHKSLLKLVDAIYKKGNRITVYTQDTSKIEGFDSLLWSYEQLSFIPHLTESDPNLDQTPIVIVSKPENHNNSNVLVLLDHTMPEFKCKFDKVVLMVDKSNDSDMQKTNKIIEDFKSSGITITQYDQAQETGQWQKIA